MKKLLFIIAICMLAAPALQVHAAAAPPPLIERLVWYSSQEECATECDVDETMTLDLGGCLVRGTSQLVFAGIDAASVAEIDVLGTASQSGFYGFGMSKIGSIATPVEITLSVSQVVGTQGEMVLAIVFRMVVAHRIPGELHHVQLLIVNAEDTVYTSMNSCIFG